MAITRMIQILILTFIIQYSSPSLAANSTYNVQSFGAKSDGRSDCMKAFESAWHRACATATPAIIYVPPGRYLLQKANFDGDLCKNKAITIRIDGTIVAPSNYNVVGKSGNWLTFQKVTGVFIDGGTLDGQGTALWSCKKSGKNCPEGATSLAFYNSNNIRINGLTSLNSQMFHIILDGCRNANMNNVTVSAPEDSPNTDGIHLQQSSDVTIMNSHIGTGDDCISIGPGNFNLWIENIACGPGHGISIGSLCWKNNEPGVHNVTVKSVRFTRTMNGLRIKTWARPCNAFVSSIHYQHAIMNNVENPIIIDQHYCPQKNCPNQASGVRISNVIYEDINGTSATPVAVKFDCPKTNPCAGITLKKVHLVYNHKPAAAFFANARVMARGNVRSTSYLSYHDASGIFI